MAKYANVKVPKGWYSADGHPCILIKKRGHKYLIDTVTNNVIAHNFLPLLAAAAPMIAKVALPAISGLVKGFLGGGEEQAAAPSKAAASQAAQAFGMGMPRERKSASEKLAELIIAEKSLK